MLHKISRRTFVATAAVAGASAVLRAPAFAFTNQSPGTAVATGAMPKGREVVPVQAVPFGMSNVRLGPGRVQRGSGSQPPLLKDTASRPPAPYLSPDCGTTHFRRAIG